MAKLPKFTLSKNPKTENWDLKKDSNNKTIKSFNTKDRATAGGTLSKAIGKDGGSVKIKKENGRFQEERTYPSSKDPKKSKG